MLHLRFLTVVYYGHIHLWHDALLRYWSWLSVFINLPCQWKQEAPLKWWHWPTKLHHHRCSYKHNVPWNFFILKWPENLRAGKVNIFICNFHNVTIHISSYTQLTVCTLHVHLFLHHHWYFNYIFSLRYTIENTSSLQIYFLPLIRPKLSSPTSLP